MILRGPKKKEDIFGEMDKFFKLHDNLYNTANDIHISDKDLKEVAIILDMYDESLQGSIPISPDIIGKIKRLLANYIALGSPCEVYLALEMGFRMLRALRDAGPMGRVILDELNDLMGKTDE